MKGDRGTWTVPGKSPSGFMCVDVTAPICYLESKVAGGRVRVMGHRDAKLKEDPNESEPGSHLFHGHVLLLEISLPPVQFRSDRIDLHR